MVQLGQVFLMLLTVPFSITAMLICVDTQNFDGLEGLYGFVVFTLTMFVSLLSLDWVMPKITTWWIS